MNTLPVPRTLRGCLHPRTRHVHGTKTAYSRDGCRCTPCTDAAAAYESHRARQAAYGRWEPYIDAGPVRAHIQQLRDVGLGVPRIAALAGVHPSTLTRLLYGRPARGEHPTARMRPAAARRLLAVPPDPGQAAPKAFIDATGTRRRIQALVAVGWSQAKLAARLGVSSNTVHRGHHQAHVEAATATAVRDLYGQLWNTQPPETTAYERRSARLSRTRAQTNGWPTPMAWDDDTIDDPTATTPEVRRATRRAAELLEDAGWLLAQAIPFGEVAARLGLTVGALQQALHRNTRHATMKGAA